jgi:hypothetical protein
LPDFQPEDCLSFTLYDATVPPLAHMLDNLGNCLEKGAAHAKEKGEDFKTYLESRLAPDMFALTRQVQVACDMAKGAGARLAGVEIPKYEDHETSLAELKARIAKTVAFLKGLDRKSFEGAENREIVLKFPNREFHFKGSDYLTGFALPNVYFHITAAYAILRSKGVPLGKSDYLRQ